MPKIILAPHLDDEVIGCYSILGEVDRIVYFTSDYREENLPDDRYEKFKGTLPHGIAEADTVFLPSRFDHHPFHRYVRNVGLGLPGIKWFYSVEMNVPWLEEEADPDGKWAMMERLYPQEVPRLVDHKYRLFKSIKPFDEVIRASVKIVIERWHRWPAAPEKVAFLRNLHRHLFHVNVRVQQFQDDRDLEYFLLREEVGEIVNGFKWEERTSCEMLALSVKRTLEMRYLDRMVQVSVYEDNENGCEVE